MKSVNFDMGSITYIPPGVITTGDMIVRSMYAQKSLLRSENDLKNQFLYVILKNTVLKLQRPVNLYTIERMSQEIIDGNKHPHIKTVILPRDGRTPISNLSHLEPQWVVDYGMWPRGQLKFNGMTFFPL